MNKILLIIGLLLPILARGNCELSWVKDWYSDKNWFHTKAIYNPRKSVELGYIKWIKNQPATGSFQYKKIRSKTFIPSNIKTESFDCKISDAIIKDITESKPEDDLKSVNEFSYTVEFKACKKYKAKDKDFFVDSYETLTIPRQIYLTQVENSKIYEENLKKILAIPELKAISISTPGTNKISVDITNLDTKLRAIYGGGDANYAVVEFDALVPEAKLDVSCLENPDCSKKVIEIPVVVMYFNDKWIFYGNGTVGKCAGYENEKSLSIVETLKKGFILPSRYVLFDWDFDDKIDAFRVVPNEMFPGTNSIYTISGEDIIAGEEDVCFEAEGACRPLPGC